MGLFRIKGVIYFSDRCSELLQYTKNSADICKKKILKINNAKKKTDHVTNDVTAIRIMIQLISKSNSSKSAVKLKHERSHDRARLQFCTTEKSGNKQATGKKVCRIFTKGVRSEAG